MRMIVIWLTSAGGIFLASAIFANVKVTDFGAALAASALVGIVNALLWPLIIRFLLPVAVLTLGLGALILNGALLLLVSSFDTGFRVDTLGAAIGTAFVMTVVNTAVSALLAIDDDSFYYRNVVKRRARKQAQAVDSTVPGLLFFEIDGLAHDVLMRAIRDGNAP